MLGRGPGLEGGDELDMVNQSVPQREQDLKKVTATKLTKLGYLDKKP